MLDDHRTAERRSLALHRAVAERLDEDRLDAARARVEGWLGAGGDAPVPPAAARRWHALLARPLDEVARGLVAEDQDAADLRQTTPFAGVVPPAERWRIVREVR